MKFTLEVRGMTCGHCESAVKKALSRVPGVVSVGRVDRAANLAEVEGEPSVDPSALVRAVEAEGYVATPSATA